MTPVSDDCVSLKQSPVGINMTLGGRMIETEVDYPEDLKLMAWSITAKHLCRGEEDVTKIVADAIWQERQRWAPVVAPADETDISS